LSFNESLQAPMNGIRGRKETVKNYKLFLNGSEGRIT
jgi:hypothetical protein